MGQGNPSGIWTLDDLYNPPMTQIETGLKQCLEAREDLQGRMLSAREMSDYILWMVENFGGRAAGNLQEMTFPVMLSEDIEELSEQIAQNSADEAVRERLGLLYRSSGEETFFYEDRDISVGRSLRYFPGYWRMDDYFEVHYLFSGECEHCFEGETVTLTAGSVMIIPPGVRKAYSCVQDDCSMLFFMIRESTFAQVFLSQLSGQNLMANFFTQALSRTCGGRYLLFEMGHDAQMERLLYGVYEEYGRNRKYSPQLVNSMMTTFFLLLLQKYETRAVLSRQSGLVWKSRFAEILNYIQDNFRTVTLQELSEKFGYCQRQIIRIIQSNTGCRFGELQTRLRMEAAASMLRGNLPAEKIAADVGYENNSSFFRAFRRYYGCTPKQYREKMLTDRRQREPDRI